MKKINLINILFLSLCFLSFKSDSNLRRTFFYAAIGMGFFVLAAAKAQKIK